MNGLNEAIAKVSDLMAGETIWSIVAIAAWALIATVAIKLILRGVSNSLRKLAQKTESIWDDVGLDLLDGLKYWVLYTWIFQWLFKYFRPSTSDRKILLVIFVVVTIFQIALWGLHLIKNWRDTVIEKRIRQNPSSSAALGLLHSVFQIVFLVVISLIGLSHVGVDVSALITGLGVGGIAVALAAQNVLGDLLASLSIALDKPFVVGDFIVAGNEKGSVEHIGIKTTRIRSLSGEQLVLSNKDLLESRIQNFKRMQERRVVLQFGVVYSTTAETIENIPIWIREFVAESPKLRFDRCHFDKYGAYSLDFELVFFVLEADYQVYMDIKQKILLKIFKKFAAEKVEFAFPTQSIFIEKNAALVNSPPHPIA